jgi:hypothetical protein
MTLFKSFLVGSTALIFTGSYALAADMDLPALPLPAPKPVVVETQPPVLACKDKKGYYLVPGSQTCVKISGIIRAEAYIHSGNVDEDSWQWTDVRDITQHATTNDVLHFGTIGRLGADTLTQTDYGTLRGNIVLQASPTGTVLRYGFIEWNNFTIGHTNTFFSADSAPGVLFGAIGDYDPPRRTIFGYTAHLNKEVSASVSLEHHDAVAGPDGSAKDLKSADALITLPATPVINNSTYLPDLVANVVGKFDWGALFVSGAVGDYRTVEVITSNKESFVGWALGFGGHVNLDMIAKGDILQAKFGYSDGASSYVGFTQDHAIVDTIDPNFNIFTTRSWSAETGFQHNWSPTWSSAIFAGYVGAQRSVDPTANVNIRTLADGRPISAWDAGGNLQWSPAESLTITGELGYGSVTTKNCGCTENTNGAFGGVFRVQRNF